MTAWIWPEGRMLMLYHWSWADGVDPTTGAPNLVHGWSQSATVDDARYIHLEADRERDAESLWVDPDGVPTMRAEAFGSVAGLPYELRDGDLPLPWVRALLDH